MPAVSPAPAQLGVAIAKARLPFQLTKTLHAATPLSEGVKVGTLGMSLDQAVEAVRALKTVIPGTGRTTTAALIAPKSIGGTWSAVPVVTKAAGWERDAVRAVQLQNFHGPGAQGTFDISALSSRVSALVDGATHAIL